MSDIAAKKKAPVLGAILLFIYALLYGFLLMFTVPSAVIFENTVNAIKALAISDFMVFFDLVFWIVYDVNIGALGIISLICIVIAVLTLIKKRGIPLFTAAAIITLLNIIRLFASVISILFGYIQTILDITAAGFESINGIFNLLDLFDGLLLEPVTRIACAVSVTLMWLFFALMVSAYADGKLGFLNKIKKLITVLFTISAILVIVCSVTWAARFIIFDMLLVELSGVLQHGFFDPLGILMLIPLGILMLLHPSVLSEAVSTTLLVISISLIGAWVKSPAVIKVTAAESSPEDAETLGEAVEVSAKEAVEVNPEEADAGASDATVGEEKADADVAE